MITMFNKPPVVIHETDLFHPHGDPDDHFDLAMLYALAQSGFLELANIIIDYPPTHRIGDPDVLATTQLSYITGVNVPIHIGTPCSMKCSNDLQPEIKQHHAINRIAEILQAASSSVYITVVGAATDVAVAGKKYPKLFSEKCVGIYLNSGSAQKDTQSPDSLEYNVKLNKSAYSAIFELDCPVYWFPCYQVVKPNWVELSGKNGTVYSFKQEEIFKRISPELQNYFIYMLQKSDAPKYLRRIYEPVDTTLLEQFSAMPRRMWSTASFFQIIGKSVDKYGKQVDKTSTDPRHFAMDLYIWQSPAINLEFIRFSSQSIVNFCKMQAEILKKYTKVSVTTNTDTFYYGDTVDLYKLYESLDVSAIDCYNNEDYIFAFYCDFMRAATKSPKKNFWVLENGDSGLNLLASMKIAAERGCELFSVFKFRPFPWGQEQSRAALVDIYGKPCKNYETVCSFAGNQTSVKPFAPKVGLYYDFDSSWAYNAKSLMLDVLDGLKYPQYILNVIYKNLYRQGISVDILSNVAGQDEFVAGQDEFGEYCGLSRERA